MKKEILNLRTSALICGLILFCSAVFAAGVGDIHVLKISAQDQRAVVKMPGGKMEIVKVGDALGNNAKIVEISDGRVVLEEGKGAETETVIIRLENGKQKVERVKKGAQPGPRLLAPSTKGEKAKSK